MVMTFTKPMVTAGETFMAALGENHLKEAYAGTAKAFQEKNSEAQLEELSKSLSLDQYKAGSSHWSNRGFRDNDGYLVGGFSTKDGKEISLHMDLHYEGGAWKISSLSK